VQKLGIVGGKGVGKSFLFQAMVYRTYAKAHSGALSYFLRKTTLFYAMQRKEHAKGMVLSEFVNKYTTWKRLPQNLFDTQYWYRLRLHYRTGILGRKESAMDVEFFDGSGEGFFQAARSQKIRQLWRDGYQDARVMVFCLPLWAAFPGKLTLEDQRKQKDLLLGFETVIKNYEELRAELPRPFPVKSILAFTMADDPRSALTRLKDQWLAPYLDSPEPYLRQLRRGSGIARYLTNARRVSEALHQEILASRDPRVSSIPEKLDFGGRPWLIPLSALDGRFLDRVEAETKDLREEERPVLPEPVPVHVELPLLVALCERHNALM
jgi:GTPase SAR1 family protein